MPDYRPVRTFRGSLVTTRAARELTAIQTAALVQRATDVARRDLVIGRVSDIGLATHHALAEGDEIVGDLEHRIQGRPLAFNALAPIAEIGLGDVQRVLRRLQGS